MTAMNHVYNLTAYPFLQHYLYGGGGGYGHGGYAAASDIAETMVAAASNDPAESRLSPNARLFVNMMRNQIDTTNSRTQQMASRPPIILNVAPTTTRAPPPAFRSFRQNVPESQQVFPPTPSSMPAVPPPPAPTFAPIPPSTCRTCDFSPAALTTAKPRRFIATGYIVHRHDHGGYHRALPANPVMFGKKKKK